MKPYTTVDTVTNVLKQISNKLKPKLKLVPSPGPSQVQRGMIHNQIAQLSLNPKIDEYVLNTEQEAVELLYCTCAALECMLKSAGPRVGRRYKSEILKLKGVINRGQALKYFGDNKLKFCGLDIVGLE